ncbi:MAG: NUDIX hydrolase [Deltaproteobacteria bacterium]|nr:NUDIX hydrolase [Deltaproteobacteria bacterium]
MKQRSIRREYPEGPVVGVGAVIFDGDRVLLARRNHEPGKGIWTLPGGVVELGETLEEALRREILEETSLTIEIGGLAKLLDRIVHDGKQAVRYHYVIADYWGWKVSGTLRPGSDAGDARFVPLGEIPSLGLHAEVVETIHTAVRMRQESRNRLFQLRIDPVQGQDSFEKGKADVGHQTKGKV